MLKLKSFIFTGDKKPLHDLISLLHADNTHFIYKGYNPKGVLNIAPATKIYDNSGFSLCTPIVSPHIDMSSEECHIIDALTGVDALIRKGDKVTVKKTGTYQITIYRCESKTLVDRKLFNFIDTNKYHPVAEFIEMKGVLSTELHWAILCNGVINTLLRESKISPNIFNELYTEYLNVKYLTDPQPFTLSNLTTSNRVSLFIMANIVRAFSECDSLFFPPTLTFEITPFVCSNDSIVVSVDILAPQTENRMIEECDIVFDARIGSSTFTNSRLETICNACSASLSSH